MTLIDANLLLYAYDTTSARHKSARAWLEDAFSRPEPVHLSWQAIVAFLRISTNPRALENPLSISEAVAIVSEWLERPMVAILTPGVRHWEILRGLLTEGQVYGPLVSDAHLAALAVEHGAELKTTDRDFSRFPGLKWKNPLAQQGP